MFLLYLLLQVTKDLAPLPLQYDLELFKASLRLGKEPRQKVKEAFPWQHHLDMFSRHGRDKCGVCSEKQHLGSVLMKTCKTIQTCEKNGNISGSVITTESGFPFFFGKKRRGKYMI